MKTKTLKNGLKVIFYKTKNNTTSIQLVVNAGDNECKISGTAHFLEHMILEGSKKYKNFEEINKAINKYGGDINAGTDQYSTSYEISIYKKYFENAIDLLADLIKNPLFNKKAIEKEREVILNETILSDENKEKKIENEIIKNSYNNSPFELNTIGKKEDIKKITKNDLIEFYKKYYTTKNIVLVIAGDLKDPFKIIEKKFNLKKSDFKTKRNKVTKKEFNKIITKTDKKIDSNKGVILFDLEVSALKEKLVTYILLRLFYDYNGGKLSNYARNKLKLYNFHISIRHLDKHQILLFHFSTTNNAELIAKKIIDKINNITITKKEFDEVILQIISGKMKSIDDSETITRVISNNYLNNGPSNLINNYEKYFREIKISDVKYILKRIKNPNILILNKK